MFSTFDMSHELNLQRSHIQIAIAALLGGIVCHRVALIIYRICFHPLAKFPGPLLLAATDFPLQYESNISGTWFETVKDAQDKYGPAVRIGPNHLALDGSVGWPQVFGIREASGKEFPKYPDLIEGGNANILSADPKAHRRLRKAMSGGFSDSNLGGQRKTIEHYIDLLIDLLTRRAEQGEDVDIVKMLNFTAFDITGDLTYNEDFNSLEGGDNKYWVSSVCEGFKGNAARRFGNFYPIFKPFVSFLLGPETVKLMQRQNRMAGEKALNRLGKGLVPECGHNDFMTYMMNSSAALTPLEMAINSSVIVMGGSETITSALSGLFFYIYKNPHAYELLIREIREAFTNECEIDTTSVSHLTYARACIEEAMRVYPPVIETMRASPGAYISGIYVPEGTGISVFQWATFRNPNNFHEPNSFRPERWLPASHPLHDAVFDQDNRSVFKPFGYGARDCIGKSLAYCEMHLIVARILYRFDVEVAPGQDDWHSSQRVFNIWYKNPLSLILKPRIAA